MRTVLLAILTLFGALATEASAQSSSALLRSAPQERPKQVQEKVASLNEEKIPEDISEIFDDLRETIAELESLPAKRGRLDEVARQQQAMSERAGELKQAISELAAAQCGSGAFGNARGRFLMAHARLDRETRGISPFSVDELTPCPAFKTQVTTIGSAGVDRWVAPDTADRPANELKELSDAYTAYEVALRKRQSALEAKLSEIQQQQSLTGNFIWFILLFGGLSLGAIFFVSRFFGETLQMEWVGSGQVTQFVTVMILLTVITMLGLSKTINAETLGTLLGGVAGYVLAQGVGRAAAREATRSLTQRQT